MQPRTLHQILLGATVELEPWSDAEHSSGRQRWDLSASQILQLPCTFAGLRKWKKKKRCRFIVSPSVTRPAKVGCSIALVISRLDSNGFLAGATELLYDKLQPRNLIQVRCCSGVRTELRDWWLDHVWPATRFYTSRQFCSSFIGSLSGSVLPRTFHTACGVEGPWWDCTPISHRTVASLLHAESDLCGRRRTSSQEGQPPCSS